ncbi:MULTISPECIES: hypothetical protein [Burkholderia]|uniref:hypothetical protein n=1 Tax=Burkholderia TaxID=32008 RepID=UPI00158B1E49|nr:hypothetical protein [Burkholderia ambifaria]
MIVADKEQAFVNARKYGARHAQIMHLGSIDDDRISLIRAALQRDGWVEIDIDPVPPERHGAKVIAIAGTLGTITALRRRAH